MRRLVLGALLVSTAAHAAPLEPDTLPVPPAPLTSSTQITLPAVPRFALPSSSTRDVRELRVRGQALLGRELTVRGYITWIYSCLRALRRPGMSRQETRRLIDDHPDLCEQAQFYLGTRPDAPPDLALPVVEVPREPNKREVIALSKIQLEMRPRAPDIRVGQLVDVTGTFARRSPHGVMSTDGLLVYRTLGHPPDGTPPLPLIDLTQEPAPALPVRTGPAMRAVVPVRDRNDSIEAYERCNAALDARHPLAAAAACRRALARWSGNHLAWYALGNALAMRNDWFAASEAYAHAVQLRPDVAMYQLYDGIAALQLAGGAPDHAPAALFKPYEAVIRLSRATLTPELARLHARRALSFAAQLAPHSWQASYYLGKVELALDHPRLAAEAFTAAIRADATQSDPYIALLELYRAWDFGAQGLALAREAAARVTTGNVAGTWYSIGMAYTANGRDRDAIAAFDRAVAGEPARALFQRGQIFARIRERGRARQDLEGFLRIADPSLGVARQIASDLLRSIARNEIPDSTYFRSGAQLVGVLNSGT